VQENRAIDNRWVGAELAHPERVAEYDYVILPGLVFAWKKRTAALRFDSKDLEIAGGDAAAAELDGFGYAGECCRPASLRGHEVEDVIVSVPVEEIQRRNAVALTAGRLLEHTHDAIGIFIRERFQQDAINETEDRRVRPNPKGKRDESHNRETRAMGQ